MIHNYELAFKKGEHTVFHDCYVWECLGCGNFCTTDENSKPCQSLNEADCHCEPVQIRTVK